MNLNIPFNGSLRLINHRRSSEISQDQRLFETLKIFAAISLGKVPIEWIFGDRVHNDYCHSAICSTPFLQSIQSGLNDASFPPEALQHFSLIPENLSFTPVMHTEYCGFTNLYTETSVKSKYPGILTSFQVIKLNVYILIGFLLALGVYIYLVRRKSLPWTLKSTISDLIYGRFGLIILIICYFSVFYVSKLLSSAFTTNYAIQSRDAPLVYLDDLKATEQLVASFDSFYCDLQMSNDSFLSSRIQAIEPVETPYYIFKHLKDDRIVFFDSEALSRGCVTIFCNFMTKFKRNANFYVHDANQRYFDTFRSMVYHKFMEKSKKVFIERAAYSCSEMGFCMDAYDWAIRWAIEKEMGHFINNIQCQSYKQTKGYPMAYHPIAFITIEDLIHLFIFLMSFSSFVFVIESIYSFKHYKPKNPIQHHSSNGKWHNISNIRTYWLRKRLTNVYPIYDLE